MQVPYRLTPPRKGECLYRWMYPPPSSNRIGNPQTGQDHAPPRWRLQCRGKNLCGTGQKTKTRITMTRNVWVRIPKREGKGGTTIFESP
mmetsp:Transcript_23764/g.47240  ORF Transcript_23764/g.47240 Transcript_23764/m.47240 type:complete len:89 (+) Transcript_23764:317-583(+)